MFVTQTIEQRAEEAALVEAATRGDRAAFGLLYQRYTRMVHGILLSHVGFSDAEDLMQDVFLSAMERVHLLHDAHAFGGWLAMIARNRAKDFYRKRRPEVELTDRSHVTAGPLTEALATLEAIQQLPECYREPLILRLVEGMTGPEIAGRTGLTADSVRVNLCRGMKLLREKLEGTSKP